MQRSKFPCDCSLENLIPSMLIQPKYIWYKSPVHPQAGCFWTNVWFRSYLPHPDPVGSKLYYLWFNTCYVKMRNHSTVTYANYIRLILVDMDYPSVDFVQCQIDLMSSL